MRAQLTGRFRTWVPNPARTLLSHSLTRSMNVAHPDGPRRAAVSCCHTSATYHFPATIARAFFPATLRGGRIGGPLRRPRRPRRRIRLRRRARSTGSRPIRPSRGRTAADDSGAQRSAGGAPHMQAVEEADETAAVAGKVLAEAAAKTMFPRRFRSRNGDRPVHRCTSRTRGSRTPGRYVAARRLSSRPRAHAGGPVSAVVARQKSLRPADVSAGRRLTWDEWRWRESNPRPTVQNQGFSVCSPLRFSRPRRSRGQVSDGLSHCLISLCSP